MASPPASALTASGLLLHGRFRVEAPLGSGGVGSVFRAVDVGSGQVVALKRLHPHLAADPTVRERFAREARVGMDLSHPVLTRTFERFEDADGLSFSMELLEGRTLKDAILAAGALPVAQVLAVTRAVLEGLGAAHAAGVVHRDLKPQNIFLGADGAVKLLDFGFARVASAAGLTTRSLVLCTPDYAAPEVVGGKPVDGRADLYALGVVLYEALTGKLPFRGTTPFELLRQHLETIPRPVRELRPDVPAALSEVVARLMAKDPAARFPTPGAVRAALDLTGTAQRSMVLSAQAVASAVCGACGEPRERSWPVCPGCGAQGASHAAGDWMVVLARAEAGSGARVLETLRSLGAEPVARFVHTPEAVVKSLPRVLVKGVGETLARLLRTRLQARDVQVELRRFGENNSDLLHKSNTAGYVFLLGGLLPWALLTGWAIFRFLETEAWGHPGALPLILTLAVSGPVAGMWLLEHAHRVLPAAARVKSSSRVLPLPRVLAQRYQQALPHVTQPALKGTLRRILERALVIEDASEHAPAHVATLLEGTRKSAKALLEKGILLAEQAQAAQDRLERAGEADLTAELESLRARANAHPEEAVRLGELMVAKEQALAQVEVLERAQLAVTQKLLRVAAALELASVQALTAASTQGGDVSVELHALRIEAEAAAETAADLEALDHRDPVEPLRPAGSARRPTR